MPRSRFDELVALAEDNDELVTAEQARAAIAAGRARDVLDILLIDALGQLNYTAPLTRRVFTERATHAFHIALIMPPEWIPELEAMAHELGLALTASAEIEHRFLHVIRTLADTRRLEPE